MNKTLVVARSEYLSAVSSKAFLIGILMMPVFMGGALVVQHLTKDQVDISDRRVAIVDHTGKLFPVLARQSDDRNEGTFDTRESGLREQVKPRFILEQYSPKATDANRADAVLSERVRRQELFGFLIVSEDAFSESRNDRSALAYHTATPSYSELPNWLEQTINAEIRRTRVEQLNVDPAALAIVMQRVQLRRFGLVETDEAGNLLDAKEDSKILTFAVPFGGMMLMFMMIMTVAPTMLNNVLEEKMQKISEFLISSVSPFQLMLGKLLGGVGVALTLSVFYLGAVYGLTHYFEIHERIPLTIYLWFVLFMLLALIVFGSIFSAIGAACSEIRDAQSLMTPVMLMVMIPMLCLGPVLKSPSSLFSQLLSLFPPATPMLMFLRIAIPPGPPLWEIVLGVALAIIFAVGCAWAAGNVFRIGILSQGQSATFRQLIQWIFSKE